MKIQLAHFRNGLCTRTKICNLHLCVCGGGGHQMVSLHLFITSHFNHTCKYALLRRVAHVLFVLVVVLAALPSTGVSSRSVWEQCAFVYSTYF